MVYAILAFLLQVIAAAGIGVLLGMLVNLVIQTFTNLVSRIKDKLRKKQGIRVVVATAAEMARAFEQEAEKQNNVIKSDELEKFFEEMGPAGTIECALHKTGAIKEEDIDFFKCSEMDEKFEQFMKAQNGVAVIEN